MSRWGAPHTYGPRSQRAWLTATQELLWIPSAEDAQAAAVRLIETLGGRVIPAEHADSGALPVDVSFANGAPLLPVAPGPGEVRAALARALPASGSRRRSPSDRRQAGTGQTE